MNIKESKLENGIKLEITGRIDTNTSAMLQSEVLKAFQKTSNLTLDLKNVDYVSSAGLRTFLIAQKTAKAKNGEFTIENVASTVLEVLKMSGFANFLIIK